MKRSIRIGETLREVESDDDYLAQSGEVFERHMTALFSALIEPEMVVADVGANIGMTALLFSDLASKVYAFEPGPSTFDILTRNLTGCENVELVNAGMGAVSEDKTLTFAKSNRSGGFVSDNLTLKAGGYATETIRIDTLDGFFMDTPERPDFIKIDVEGFEPQVLRGGQALLTRHRPIVVLELNHFCLNVMQRVTLPDFFDQLRAIFPVLLAVDNDNSRLADLHNPDTAYAVMHAHATAFRFPNIVAGFSGQIGPRLNTLIQGHPRATQ